jgi:alpha-L-fucosidase
MPRLLILIHCRYWNHLENPNDPTETYQYHKETYGENVVYDDFIQNFTAENFDPKDWVDLIADAGARYFVPTSKHHEGFALFDMPSNVSERNSVKQTPHRDLLKVRGSSPNIRPGTLILPV